MSLLTDYYILFVCLATIHLTCSTLAPTPPRSRVAAPAPQVLPVAMPGKRAAWEHRPQPPPCYLCAGHTASCKRIERPVAGLRWWQYGLCEEGGAQVNAATAIAGIDTEVRAGRPCARAATTRRVRARVRVANHRGDNGTTDYLGIPS